MPSRPPPTDDRLRMRVRTLLHHNATEGFSALLNEHYCYIKPSPVKYPFQWFWDTCFHVFMLCALDAHELAKRNLQSLFSMQTADGFVGHMIFWKSVLPTAYTDILQSRPGVGELRPHMSALIQPTFAAQALLRIYEETRDEEYLRLMLPKVKKYLQWLHANRDFDDDGLLTIISPFESGMDYKPSFDSVIGFPPGQPNRTLFRRAAAIDLANFLRRYRLPAIRRAGKFLVKEATVNTAYALDLEALARLCRIVHDADAATFTRRAKRVAQRMMEVMFDEQSMAFFDVAGPKNRKLRVLTPTILFPALLPDIPRALCEKILKRHILNPDEFVLPFPVPSLAKGDPSFTPDPTWFLWRGPTWAFHNWFLHRGLRRRGFGDEAAPLLRSLRALIVRSGFREYYNPLNGRGGGEHEFTWSGLIVDMMSRGPAQKE